jgi:hypothetical protein
MSSPVRGARRAAGIYRGINAFFELKIFGTRLDLEPNRFAAKGAHKFVTQLASSWEVTQRQIRFCDTWLKQAGDPQENLRINTKAAFKLAVAGNVDYGVDDGSARDADQLR